MKKNILLYTIIMIITLSVTISIFSLYNLRKTGIESAIHNAKSISEVIKSGLTAHMLNGNMNQIDTFMESASNIKNVEKLWLVRSQLVNNQFNDNPKTNAAKDEIDKKVIKTGKMMHTVKENITNTTVRVTIPYNAIAEKGINCFKCHHVQKGQTLGAVSIVLDISPLKEIGLESIYIILILILTTITLFILISKKIINPYLTLYEKIRTNIHEATLGNFKPISLPSGLNKEMIDLTEEYNGLINYFNETTTYIDKKVQGFVGYNNSSSNKNPLNHSKDIINNLSNLYQFKKQVELDNSKKEIYTRLAEVFKNKFNLKNFTFIEIDTKKNKLNKVLEEGKAFYCEKKISDSPDLCRAARTKNDVVSNDYHNTCPNFENKENQYYCFNINIAKNIVLIVQCICESNKELEELKDNTDFIKKYLKEATPSIEVKILMNALKDSAHKDVLTELYNRKFLEEYLKKMLPKINREKQNIGVLMLDMDHFKAVNDEYGHDIGDKVLKELSKILTETLRESDVVIRYGGEEFLVLLIDIDNEENALKVANKLSENVSNNEIDVYAGSKLKKTISIGLSMYPQDSSSFDACVKNADIALYEAKNNGRNQVIRFSQEYISSVDLF